MDFPRLQALADAAVSQMDGEDTDAAAEAERAVHGFLFRQVVATLGKRKFKRGGEVWSLLAKVAHLLPLSKAQLHQDLWVLYEHGRKRPGFFVEFGAANGMDLSNTWLLEKHFGWTGVLAEPNPDFHESLTANRSCAISFDCVFNTTGELTPFFCTERREYSRMGAVAPEDGHELKRRQVYRETMVRTVTLNDLLKRHDAPRTIDYISLDTEGSEYDILAAFDFDAWDVRLISVEHNNTPMRGKLHDLLTRHGYARKFSEISLFDDWYARAS